MKDNSRFVLAVHTLTLLAEKQEPLSSAFIAQSAGVNPVTVRKLVGQLRAAGLVQTKAGAIGGTTLALDPALITLKDTFLAVRDESIFGTFPDAPSPECSVGRNLRPTLVNILADAMQSMISTLDGVTIADVLSGVLHPSLG